MDQLRETAIISLEVLVLRHFPDMYPDYLFHQSLGFQDNLELQVEAASRKLSKVWKTPERNLATLKMEIT